MPLTSFDDLFRLADARRARVPVAAVGAADVTVLEALSRAAARGWIAPVLVGREAEIRTLAGTRGVDLGAARIVDSDDPAAAAVAEVRAGRAAFLMKGKIDTPALMRAVLDSAAGLRTARTICQVVLMEIVDQARRFLLADTGITIAPTVDQKAEIAQSLTAVARALGADVPRVAILSASEKVSSAMPDTLDARALVERAAGGEFGNAVVQGPLSWDLAYSVDAVEKKAIEGAVAGAADAMLFPDLLAANLTVKALMYAARSRFGGVLCGAAAPVVFMSRADTVETRLNSLALALRLA